MLLKRLRPSIWLPLIVVLWGVAMLCQGVVKDYGGLVTTRVFLGIFEAGLFPGAQVSCLGFLMKLGCGYGLRRTVLLTLPSCFVLGARALFFSLLSVLPLVSIACRHPRGAVHLALPF